jgi:ceramide glucosyltransferase
MWSTILAGLAGTSLGATLLSQACAFRVVAHRRTTARTRPPVSILKPLKGVDDDLHANLLSFARQSYPDYELILGAEDPLDPALAVARDVARRHPDLPIKVVTSPRRIGLNPKVNNLSNLIEHARHERILISDSNVVVDTGYLESCVAELEEPGTALVCNVISGDGEQTVGATMENMQLNSFVIAGVCGASVLAGHPCVIGKSMLLRRRDLDAVGGLEGVADVLAEDYLLGRRLARRGRVAVSGHVIRTLNRTWTVGRFLARHLRWSQMRRQVAPLAYAFEPLLNPTPWLLALAVVLASRGSSSVALPLAGVVLKTGIDYRLAARIRGWRPRLADVPLTLVKDVCVLLVWVVAWGHRTVEWRGNRLRIGPGSRLSRVRPLPEEVVDEAV